MAEFGETLADSPAAEARDLGRGGQKPQGQADLTGALQAQHIVLSALSQTGRH